MEKYRLIFFLVMAIAIVIPKSKAQENAQTRIPESLIECYQNPELLQRDNRLPMTINTLIELIRKVEDSEGYTKDMRQLAVALIHRFRLDGVVRAPGQFAPNVLPFSPSGFQFSKHRIILSRLLQGNAMGFPNSTLTSIEKCTFHFMLSSSIETQVRNDEGERCNQLSQYRAQRIPRSVPVKNNFIGDIEMLDELLEYQERKNSGRYQLDENDEEDVGEGPVIQPREDGAFEDVATFENVDAFNSNNNNNNAISQCPVENGVVRTSWGAISAGTLIAGIAAGLQPISITSRELMALSRSREHARQTQALNVDNRWATTLSGDLAEVTLLQGPIIPQISVGAPGAWNSSQIPRWYFLSQRERLEMTDAEIRGGIDGLILAMNVAEYRRRSPTMRLSQLLDMYYSQRGVFGSNVRSCNRRDLFTEVAPLDQIQAQTISFTTVLDLETRTAVTLGNEAIQQFSIASSAALSAYVPQSLNDLSCETTARVPNDPTIWRTATNLFIYVDTTWTYREIQPIIAHLLDHLDIHRFGSNYTILNAMNGGIIVPNTNSLSDFHQFWTQASHQTHPQGLSLPDILRNVHTNMADLMNGERDRTSVGGQSLVTLIVPQMAGLNEADNNFAFEQSILLREQVPDLLLLFLAGGTPSRFSRFVRQENRDLFTLQVSSGPNANVGAVVDPVIRRIQEVPRRIINHRCGANWTQDNWGGNSMNQYVERGGISFYRVAPNYFFYPRENRRVRVTGHGYSTISVCTSRTIELPRANSTTATDGDVDCRQLNTNSHDLDLTNACDGHFLIQHCPPLFISVEGLLLAGEQDNLRCNDRDCRFPDSIRFTINPENLDCRSGGNRLMLSALAVVLWSLFLVNSF